MFDSLNNINNNNLTSLVGKLA